MTPDAPGDLTDPVNRSSASSPRDLDETPAPPAPASSAAGDEASGQPVNAATATAETDSRPAELVPAAIAAELAGDQAAGQHAACALLYLANLSGGSRRTMRASLDLLAHLLSGGTCDHTGIPWGALRSVHTRALRAALLARGCAPATGNRHLAALRGVLYNTWRSGLMSADDYHAAIDLEPIRGERAPAGRGLSHGELRALFEACASDSCLARGLRDAAVIALLYQALLRRSEAVSLDLADYDPQSGELRVIGKGNREDTVHVDGGGRRAVDAWIKARGDEPGPLLCAVPKSGRVLVRRLSDDAVRRLVERRAAQAGVQDVSAHDFRRSGISDSLDAGVDLSTVQRRARHRSPKTTSGYDRRGERAKREAAGRLHVPFVEPRRG